jgi:hypothetical protein
MGSTLQAVLEQLSKRWPRPTGGQPKQTARTISKGYKLSKEHLKTNTSTVQENWERT